LGGLFIAVVLLFPDGLVGLGHRLRQSWRGFRKPVVSSEAAAKG